MTAVDLSPVPLERAAQHARTAGLVDRITFTHHDLDQTFRAGSFDLVAAHYLHSPNDNCTGGCWNGRSARSPQAARCSWSVTPRSRPWSWDQRARFPTARQVLDGLELASQSWVVDVCEGRPRHAIGPNDESATVLDSIVRMRRAT